MNSTPDNAPEMQNLPAELPVSRPKREFRPVDRIAAVAVCLLSILFLNNGFEDRGLLIWLPLILLLVGTPFYLRRFSIRLTPKKIALYALLPLFALPRLLYDSGDVYLLSHAFVLPGFMYIVHLICGESGRLPGECFVPELAKAVFAMPLSEYTAAPEAIRASGKKGIGRAIGAVLLGLGIAVIPTVVVLILLVLSDRNFERMFENILQGLPEINIGPLLFAIPLGILLGFYVFGHLWASGTHALGGGVKEETAERIKSSLRFSPVPMVCAAVFPLLCLYLLFFASQIPYFIGGFSGTLPEGLTYADYARRGFFELCTVAVINAAVLCGINLFTRRKDDRLPIPARITAILLSFFTLTLLTSATAKMLLYIDSYGLSRKRIYVLWLMGLLAVIFLLGLLHQFLPRMRTAALIFAAVVLFVGIFLFADFDRIIADYNVDAYLNGQLKTVDVDMIGRLSAGSTHALLRLYDEAEDHSIRERTAVYLDRFAEREYEIADFNFSRAAALRALKKCPEYERGFVRSLQGILGTGG